MHILLVEDHADLAANLGEFLESRGETVDYAADGLTGLHLACTNRYDAVVLDVGLPVLDGVTLCRRLRTEGTYPVPIIMLTARDTEDDKLKGFASGADDYLTKPFSLPELHARLQAMARRAKGFAHTLQVADLVFDTRTQVIRRGERRLILRPVEVRLLDILMRSAPALVQRQEVVRQLWGDSPPGSDAALRGHIHALRSAIDIEGEAVLLHTVHGVGYRLGYDDA
ncbi:MAG: response regulator transcription factor [Moraxellaceae bacterium]|jgi:DNA-binding response OmpR family regulator|nr:response regulator transcription factor [Moraxellaceae bacterium]MBP7229185.1 response regulator transcription factor [Moraxellaceae bacterium]MBP8851746.1 response regulator transcription factor [Moraxellaceae bacterium]MBP9045637.1 response regulator transcription factor [Moraxellaceae bacterium]MBP9730739.1 response regulator transcription factor [Moraxellaceae bacterium]